MIQLRITKQLIVEVTGWSGTIAVVLAYILVSFEFLASTSAHYQLLNLAGAICIIIHSRVKKSRPVIALNIVWAIIASTALLEIISQD